MTDRSKQHLRNALIRAARMVINDPFTPEPQATALEEWLDEQEPSSMPVINLSDTLNVTAAENVRLAFREYQKNIATLKDNEASPQLVDDIYDALNKIIA